MGNQRRDRTKAVGVLALSILGFLMSLLIGFYFFDVFVGVGVGLGIICLAGFIAYELWWNEAE